MTQQESTIANADLWSRYFHDEWSRWLQPFAGDRTPVSQVAEGTGARVASWLTLVAAGPIAWLYNASAPRATEGRGRTFARIAPDLESVEEPAA